MLLSVLRTFTLKSNETTCSRAVLGSHRCCSFGPEPRHHRWSASQASSPAAAWYTDTIRVPRAKPRESHIDNCRMHPIASSQLSAGIPQHTSTHTHAGPPRWEIVLIRLDAETKSRTSASDHHQENGKNYICVRFPRCVFAHIQHGLPAIPVRDHVRRVLLSAASVFGASPFTMLPAQANFSL